jgi:hypothetical protein
MKKIFFPIIILMLSFFWSSCSKFEEINTNPNSTTEVTPELLATNLILTTMEYPPVGKDFLYKDMLAKYISYMEGATDYQYNKFGRTYYSSLVELTNIEKMNEAAKGSVYETSYQALGHFIRAYTFFNLTMSVGDIPYSDALKGEEGVYNPKYDTQKDVLLGILDELDEAANLFNEGRNFAGDPVYNGDVLKWQKACNALSLKILTHLWKKISDPDLDIAARFDAIVKENKIMQSNNDNLQLVYSDVEVEFYPFYNSTFRNYPIMSTTIVDMMKEMEDYRLFYYAEPAKAQTAAGVAANDWDAYVGVDPSNDFTAISQQYVAGEISGINPRYSTLPQGEPTFLLSYAEQSFIIAEGIIHGWTDGKAEDYYLAGIRAAFNFVADNTPNEAQFHHNMKITASVISTYSNHPSVALTGSPDEDLRRIFQQRYFMGFMQDGWNTYYEYRRTGYPELPVNPQTNLNSMSDRIPVRWMYPSDELSYNRENTEEALARQFNGNDDVNQLMWILKD